MQNVVINDAIDAIRHRERQWVVLHLDRGHLIHMQGGAFGGLWISLDPSSCARGFIR